MVLHVAIFASLSGTHVEAPSPTAQLAIGTLVDVAVPGFGPPGAPSGEAAAADSPDQSDPPAAPLPRVRAAASTAPSLPVATDVEAQTQAPSEGEGQSADAFLDSLIARADGRGDGAGGAGGAGCPDPIAGIWRARRFNRVRGTWGVFTLKIERDGAALTGAITLHSWTGDSRDRHPPPCAPGIFEHTVVMNADGRLEGRHVRFDARDHRRTVQCMSAGRFAYNLDHFTGTLATNRILAVNNDGGWEVNTPYTFRRVSCE